MVRYYSIRDFGFPDLVVVKARNGVIIRSYWRDEGTTNYPELESKDLTDRQLFKLVDVTDYDALLDWYER